MIKNIIFDFGNVIIEWNTDKIVKYFSNEPKDQELLKQVVLGSKEWIQLDEGTLECSEAIEIFEERLPKHLKGTAKNIVKNWYKFMPINNDIKILIKKLKNKNYKIFGLSNTNKLFYEYLKNSELGKYFDGFIISSIEKVIKPNKEIYSRLFNKFDLKPNECFFIDDGANNIKSAIECGMKGYVFKFNDIKGLEEELIKNNILINEEYFDVLNECGEFTDEIATREECHKKGLWHRAVYGFIFNKKGDVLLQKRAKTKKLWPDLWDITAGGHVLAGEFGEQALQREIKEELGLDVATNEIKYLVGSTSTNIQGDIINNHFNECYIVTKDVDISKIKLQEEEVSDIKWFTKQEIFDRINNDFEGITDKTGPWNFLKRYYEVCTLK